MKMFIILLAAFLISGCADKVELEDRLYAVTVGLDAEGSKITMSAGEARLESEIGDENEKQKNAVVSGKNIAEIKQKADMHSDKKLYFGHLKTVVLGKDILIDSEKFENIVFDAERMSDINSRVVVFAAENAENIVSETMKNDGGGLYLRKYYRNNGKNEYMDFETIIKAVRENTVFVIPKIKSDENGIVFDGGYLMKGSSFVGEFSENEINGLMWLKGEAKGEMIGDEEISAEVRKEKITYSDKNIFIKADCILKTAGNKNSSICGKIIENVIKRNIENTINKAVEYGIAERKEVEVSVNIVSTGVIK